MNQKTDIDLLRERARGLFISQATIEETLEWATPRQLDAIDRMLATELANRESTKRARLMRQARFPVPKGLDGYDFTNVRLPDGYDRERLLALDFMDKAQDLVFYGKTGRGKTHLATALGMKAVERGRSVRFRQTAELVLQLGKAKRDGTLDNLLKDLSRADLIILDEFGYVPFDIDGARLLYQIIAGSYERRSIIFTTNIESGKWGTIFADDKLAAAFQSTASSTTDASSSSPVQAGASARPSCSAKPTPANNPTNHRRHARRRNPKKISDENRNADLTKYTRPGTPHRAQWRAVSSSGSQPISHTPARDPVFSCRCDTGIRPSLSRPSSARASNALDSMASRAVFFISSFIQRMKPHGPYTPKIGRAGLLRLGAGGRLVGGSPALTDNNHWPPRHQILKAQGSRQMFARAHR